jgi:PPOX class F420-dependent enzyme/OxyR family protein
MLFVIVGVGGINILKSRKYKNVLKNNKVALVIDDLKTIDAWHPRGIRIYGTADIVTRQSGYMEQAPHPQADYIRIKPEKKWSWGIHEPFFLSTNSKPARKRYNISSFRIVAPTNLFFGLDIY